jgi:hypothetical protein
VRIDPEALEARDGAPSAGRSHWWREWGIRPEDEPELSPEAVALLALEPKLADVRRILVHAGHVRCPYRSEVRALGALAEQLHRQVLMAALREGRR